MNPTDRAEKIGMDLARKIIDMEFEDMSDYEIVVSASKLIAAEIQQAVEDSYQQGKLDGDSKLREEASKGIYTPDREAWYERRIAETYKQAKSEAYEEAAKVAYESTCADCGCEDLVPKAIRALKQKL